MQLFKAKIEYCKEIAPSYFKMGLLADIEAEPGQFFHIKCFPDNTFRLRRPFSLHRKLENGFEILFERKGEGTEFLSHLKKGDILDILGPCGNGFKIMEKSIIVGGGIGIAPLFELSIRCKKPKVLIGAKTKDSLLCVDDFRNIGISPIVSTDDGSFGYHGFVTDLLLDSLDSVDSTILYACGPQEMLERVVRIAKEKNVPCQISVEAILACGVGACLGCAYKTKNGYKRVCKDGPVFDVNEL
ncbi:MAG: dihydroorotate dehydrogenase electron transfer subunit [bacterium]